MQPTRECRMRQWLNRISRTDETDTIPQRHLKDVKDAIDYLKQVDEENGQSDAKETLIDVQIYNTSNTVTYNCISMVEFAETEYNLDTFLHRLQAFVTNDTPDEYSANSLMKLCSVFDMDAVLPRNEVYSSLYVGSSASLQPETPPNSQKTRKRTVRNANVAEKRKFINIVDQQPLTDEQKTNNILKQYLHMLNERYKQCAMQPINYYQFILDKNDFGKTVENAFYTSFLVNNGSMKLFADDENNLLLEPSDKRDHSEQHRDETKCRELAMNINYAQWKNLCENC